MSEVALFCDDDINSSPILQSQMSEVTIMCYGDIKYARVPVQRAVGRDEIPYPYKLHDATLRPLLHITRAEPLPVCLCPLVELVPVCIYPFNG